MVSALRLVFDAGALGAGTYLFCYGLFFRDVKPGLVGLALLVSWVFVQLLVEDE